MKWRRLVETGHGYPAALGAVLLTTLAALPLRAYLPAAAITLLYVPVIIGVARLWGVRVSAASAVAAFIALDLIFVEPYYRLSVESAIEWIGLIVFLIIALVAGQQTALLREREQAALRRQSELELLNRVAFRMTSEQSVTAASEYIVGQLTAVLGASGASLYAAGRDGQAAECLAVSGDAGDAVDEAAFVAWVVASNKAVGLVLSERSAYEELPASVGPAEALPGKSADGVYLPLQTSHSVEGVLHVRPGESNVDVGPPGLLAAVASLAASSFERQRLEGEAARAEALGEADQLKSTLVSSVSHELKTPLAAAVARVTGLLDEGEGCGSERVRQELAAVANDLARLDSSIGDLLDLSRLESDAWRPSHEQHDIGDVLGTVLARLAPGSKQRVRFDLDEDLPLVSVDFAQLARALSNIVENALAYSPSDAPVVVTARHVSDDVRITVEDSGPGVPAAERTAVFGKFYRGSASTLAPAGTGLGLTIADEIVRMHGGRIWVEDAIPHGARFVVMLPASEAASESDTIAGA